MESSNSFVNIITPVFTSETNEISSERVYVKLNTSGTFSIDEFSLLQFLLGYKLWLDQMDQNKEDSLRIKIAILMSTLTLAFLKVSNGDHEQKLEHIELTRNDVKFLREILETRMRHCEKERDDRNPAFNADTYISMKLLLLNIREWLVGEEIPAPQIPANTHVDEGWD